MNGRLNNRDRLFIRLDKRGIAIADSAIWRKQIPRGQGRWKDITEAVLGCCSTTEPTQGSFLIIQYSTFTVGTVTKITYPGYDWEGTVTNGYLVVPVPYDLTEDVVLTFSTLTGTGVDISATTLVGTDTVTLSTAVVANGAAGQTMTITVPSTPGSQYLITLTDD